MKLEEEESWNNQNFVVIPGFSFMKKCPRHQFSLVNISVNIFRSTES